MRIGNGRFRLEQLPDISEADSDLEAATQVTQVFIWVGIAAMLLGYGIWWVRKRKT